MTISLSLLEQSAFLTLERDRATGEAYCMPDQLTRDRGACPRTTSITHPGTHTGLVFAVALAILSTAGAALADEKRALPDYDGQGNVDADDGSDLLWIPRILLSPLYVVNEFVIRRPLGAFVTLVERNQWQSSFLDFFAFDPEHKTMLVPTFFIDFGFLPSVGLYFFSDDLGTPGNDLRLHAATWGPDWIAATALERYTWDHGHSWVAARVELNRRKDLVYRGIGPDVTDATRSRYGLQRFDAGLEFTHHFLMLSAGVRLVGDLQGGCCNDPTLSDRIAAGQITAPPGFDTPYTALYQRADLLLDSRAPRPGASTGVHLGAHGETDFDVRNDRSWVAWGGEVGASLDLDGKQRTLQLIVSTDFVDSIGDNVVPFDQLAFLGGDNLMPGFTRGWMLGRSTAAAALSYSWPIWAFLDGELRFSVGNAFGEHLEGFSFDKLRLSGDISIASIGSRDSGFQILFGLGAETFAAGTEITTVRFAIGSRKGF